MATSAQLGNKSDETFKCHSNMKIPKIVICIICECVYHESDFNRFKKGFCVGKRLIVCPDHGDVNITPIDHATLDENSRKIIAYIKQHEKEDLKICLSSSVMLDSPNSQDILNKTVRNNEDKQLLNAKVEIELLRELNQELKSKNNLLAELLEINKAEVNKCKSYTEILKEDKKEIVFEKVPAIVVKSKNKETDKNYAQLVKKNIAANTSAQIKNDNYLK
ncbi:uncharacterized protein LOC141525936 [Cotesia typhae]|uniref:uncharacterized protein LOC141525936 n=1 Tax=Cotesia typhae TaxID=2053667 RepID=UPI003D6952BC